MGVQSSKPLPHCPDVSEQIPDESSPSRSRPLYTSIHYPRSLDRQDPDVESLGVPFNVCYRIFLLLPLPDLVRCLSVCKEWRSLLDTCTFWRTWIHRHWDFAPLEPEKDMLVGAWREAGDYWSSLDIQVFQVYPDMWGGRVLVPAGLGPPCGNLDSSHQFVRARHWIEQLLDKVEQLGSDKEVNVCMLPWRREHMPNGKEVMDVFNLHPEIVKSSNFSKALTKDELKSCFGLFTKSKGMQINKDLYLWLCARVGKRTLVAKSNSGVVKPAPCFILTNIAVGWLGGLVLSANY